jgi:ATP-binding protein involved in chromosome partitioning
MRTLGLQVPILGLVENMAYLDCGCGQRHKPFGEGHGNKLKELYGIPLSWSVPIQQV